MIGDVVLIDIPATVMASVRGRAAWGELPRVIPPLLGKVWNFLKGGPVKVAGHNVVVYRNPTKDGVELECGVQVAARFADAGEIACSETPGGRAAHVTYTGPYSGLGAAHDAVGAFCDGRGLPPGIHWEVYGDWEEDPQKLRTDVYRLAA
jgi:hypothetical protein